MSNLTRAVAAAKLVAKAHAPTIMVVSGVVSMGASVITASKKTLKVEEVLERHVPDLEKIKQGKELDLPSYDSNAQLKDLTVVYTHVGMDLTKLYFVPGVLFIGGAALVFGGHRVMLKRNATLAIAFTGLQKAFDAYRQNVRDEFGDTADQGMLNGYKEVEVYDDKSGKTQTIRTRDWDNVENDPYNKVFSAETSDQFINDLGVNKLFIANQQRMANIKLGLDGYLYLNDVYESLGMRKTDVGQVCGWKERRLPDGSRDIPFIDLGLDKPMPDDWKYTANNEIYLDINCQGLIVGGQIQKELER